MDNNQCHNVNNKIHSHIWECLTEDLSANCPHYPPFFILVGSMTSAYLHPLWFWAPLLYQCWLL